MFLKDSYEHKYKTVEISGNMKTLMLNITIKNQYGAVITAVYGSPESNTQEFFDKLNFTKSG